MSETLVVAADVFGALTQQDLERVQFSLGQAAEIAGREGVRLALEFQAQATLMNNLQTAAAFVAEVGSPHLGLCFDAFQYYMGPSKEETCSIWRPKTCFMSNCATSQAWRVSWLLMPIAFCPAMGISACSRSSIGWPRSVTAVSCR